jgi:hypothetical protein
VFGGAVAILNRQSGGWFDFYVFELPKHHPIIGQLLRGFWIDDFLGPLAIATVIGSVYFFAPPVRARWRWLVVDAAFIGALIVAGYATRVRVGSYVNVVLPAYLGVALLFGLGVAALAARRSAEPAARLAARWLLLLCVAQFAVLAYKPWKQIPPARDRVAGEQIVASLKAVQGDVWVPRHPYLGAMAGKPWHAHELALQDVLRREELPQQHAFAEELHQAACVTPVRGARARRRDVGARRVRAVLQADGEDVQGRREGPVLPHHRLLHAARLGVRAGDRFDGRGAVATPRVERGPERVGPSGRRQTDCPRGQSFVSDEERTVHGVDTNSLWSELSPFGGRHLPRGRLRG